MLGAIIGDIVGSVYEFHNVKSKEFPLFSRESRFTDDTVMTLAVSEACIELHRARCNEDALFSRARSFQWFQGRLITIMQALGRSYPDAGYGARFRAWLSTDDPKPYGSFGNGSAMRVSPVAYFARDLEDALTLARLSAELTHNHPEGIRGAEAVAAAVYLALHGSTKEEIADYISANCYSLRFTLDDIRPTYRFDVSCQGSVPVAIRAFLEGESFEDTIRNAISVGGDSDTIAAIAGAIAEPYFKDISPGIADRALSCLDEHLLSIYRRGVKLRPYTY